MIFNKKCKTHEKITCASRVFVREIPPDGQMAGQTDAQAPLPALRTSSDGHLSFNALLYFQRYAPDKLYIAKNKGSNSVNTGDMLWLLHSVIPFMVLYQCVNFHLFIFNTFREILRTSLLLQTLERETTL